MEYQVVYWNHEDDAQPVALYSELDEERWEIRKLEVYRTGRMDVAGRNMSTGSSVLGEVPVPPLEGINRDDAFCGHVVSLAEFEAMWNYALSWWDLSHD